MEGNNGIAVLLLLMLGLAGIVIMFNLLPDGLSFLTGGSLAFGNGGIFTYILRLIVAPLMSIMSGYVIFNILRGGF